MNLSERGLWQMLGEWLYPRVAAMPQVTDPAKVTGMLLEMDPDMLLGLLYSPQDLFKLVDQAVACLATHQASSSGQPKKDSGGPKRQGIPSNGREKVRTQGP